MAKAIKVETCATVLSNLKAEAGTVDGQAHNSRAFVPLSGATTSITNESEFMQWCKDLFVLHKNILGGMDVEVVGKKRNKDTGEIEAVSKSFTPLDYSSENDSGAIASGKPFVPRDILAGVEPNFSSLAEMIVDNLRLKHGGKAGAALRREYIPSKGGKRGRAKSTVGAVEFE